MAQQRLHAAMAPIDVLTRVELEEVMTHRFDAMLRDRFRGLDIARFPNISAPGTGSLSTPVNLSGSGLSDGICGPEQGDIWLVRRANVISSTFPVGDGATYTLFRGSTPSDPGQYTAKQLIDGMAINAGSSVIASSTSSNTPTLNLPLGAALRSLSVTLNGTDANPGTITIVGGEGPSATIHYYLAPGQVNFSQTYTPALDTYTMAGAEYEIQLSVTGLATAVAYITATYTLPIIGQQVGLAYNPGTKSVWLLPGEQLYAQVSNTSTGATYTMNGEAIRIPAEMRGKLLG